MNKGIEQLVEIRIHNTANDTVANREDIFQLFTELLKIAKKRKIWDSKIVKIIVSDNFNYDVEEQARKWGIDLNQQQERGSSVFSKSFQNPKKKGEEFLLIFPMVPITNGYSPIYIYLVIGQISLVFARKIIPSVTFKDDSQHGLEDFVRRACVIWCKTDYSEILTHGILDASNLVEHHAILNAFKRKLKRLLYDYNSDKYEHSISLWNFWEGYSKSIETLFIDLIRNSEGNQIYFLEEDEVTSLFIKDVICEIKALTKKFLEKDELFNVDLIRKSIIKFSDHFSISLTDINQVFRIELSKDPKDYFLGIVDTEPRIVCFIDILGFSDLINSYDEDLTSTVLQDIQESFFFAKNYLLDDALNFHDKEIIKHLKYQSFSDNICISIPFFDTEHDFVYNFRLLVTYVQSFQLFMMTRGFFTRGGISLGSYYADESIIFSKGLVKAYNLESKKALYPRVVIDSGIIDRLKRYSYDIVKVANLHKTLIFDWEDTTFLNPFGLLNEAGNFKGSFISKEKEFTITENYDVASAMNKIIANLLQDNYGSEFTEFNSIKQIIGNNLRLYANNSSVATKYTWLLEFIKWLEKDGSGSLKFFYFSDRLNTL